jgi:cytidine deaminase
MNEKWIMNYIYQKIEIERIKKERFHYAYLLVSKNKTEISDGKNNFIENKTCTTIHAEIAALEKIKKWKECPKNVDLIVIKLNKDGNIGKGKPCDHCLYLLSESKVNIKNVYYSTIIDNEYYIIKEKFSKMKNYNKNDKKVMSKSPRYKCGEKIYCSS